MSLQDVSTLGCSHRRTNDCLSLLAGLSVSKDTYPFHPAVVPILIGRHEIVQRYTISSNIVLILM